MDCTIYCVLIDRLKYFLSIYLAATVVAGVDDAAVLEVEDDDDVDEDEEEVEEDASAHKSISEIPSLLTTLTM